ncbi:MAG TPA: hypothetical protein VJT50_01780 [Pyrinomonadaceae bacterium]|nr:hypothetical protein [Pyrinomonadaceae bacterium]
MSKKVLPVLGLVLMSLASSAGQNIETKQPQESVAKQKATGLDVSIRADKRRYRRSDDIDLEVMLINTSGVKDIFVYGTLEFGLRASLMVYRRDAKGRNVPTRFFPHAWELPPARSDTSAFVKLLPDHFLGTFSRSSIQKLGMVKPGRYSLWVEYNSPISIADVAVSPFWGSENGIIKSNVVWIEVVR